MRIGPWEVTRRDIRYWREGAIIAGTGSPVATWDIVDIRSAIEDASVNYRSTDGRSPASPMRPAGDASRHRRIRRSRICVRRRTELLSERQIFIGEEATNAGGCREG